MILGSASLHHVKDVECTQGLCNTDSLIVSQYESSVVHQTVLCNSPTPPYGGRKRGEGGTLKELFVCQTCTALPL